MLKFIFVVISRTFSKNNKNLMNNDPKKNCDLFKETIKGNLLMFYVILEKRKIKMISKK